MSSDVRPDGPIPNGTRTSLWPFVAAAVVVAVVLAAVIVVSVVGGTPARRNPAERSAASGHARDLVVHDGDSVTGQGEVIAVPGRPVRFCRPTSTPAPVPVGVSCGVGIDVTGVNLGRLSRRHSTGGTVTGLAGLAGTYRKGTLKVSVQSSYVAPPATTPLGRRAPCPAPTGGWPAGPVDLAPARAYALAHPGSIVESTVLKPSSDEAVAYVLAAGDPAPVRAGLARVFGSGLCVARSRFTRPQLDRAAAAVHALPRDPALTAVLAVTAAALSAAGQPEVSVAVAVVSPSVAAAVDAQPAGLVRLTAWLSPTS